MAPTLPTRVGKPRAAKKHISYKEGLRATEQKDGKLVKTKTTPKNIAKPAISTKRGGVFNATGVGIYRAWGASPFFMPIVWNADGSFRVASGPWKDEGWNDVEPKGDWKALVNGALKEVDKKNGTKWAKRNKKEMFREEWCKAFKDGGELRELVEKGLVSEKKVQMWESERRMGIARIQVDWDEDFEWPHKKREGYLEMPTKLAEPVEKSAADQKSNKTFRAGKGLFTESAKASKTAT